MTQNDEVTALLKEAVGLLRIIARPQIVELRERFNASMLSSAKRREMWANMDGSRTLSDIGRKVGTSTEAVRLFVGETQAKWPDLLEVKASGGAMYPRRLI